MAYQRLSKTTVRGTDRYHRHLGAALASGPPTKRAAPSLADGTGIDQFASSTHLLAAFARLRRKRGPCESQAAATKRHNVTSVWRQQADKARKAPTTPLLSPRRNFSKNFFSPFPACFRLANSGYQDTNTYLVHGIHIVNVKKPLTGFYPSLEDPRNVERTSRRRQASLERTRGAP